ncbi:MAG TPA: imidazolonepropionase [Acidimicrobiales bacterium]|nr:imidazolonepropionase [Acidimicrobiales bacterium]
MRSTWDLLVVGARLPGMTDDGAVAVRGDRIAFAGARADLPHSDAADVLDVDGRLVTPGLIDCHTHLVFGGHRAHEYEQRLAGTTYAELAAGGGGILATVRATRAATEQELFDAASARLAVLAAGGVTTVEIKSGYGLDLDTELAMLRVARALGRSSGVRVMTTFLGAHTVPPEWEGRADGYVDHVCQVMLPAVAQTGLADAVDVFCDHGAFTPEQSGRVLAAARAADLPVKVHADQLSDLGAADLAARFGALSADHLEHTGEAGVAALARSGTVAVLLPGAAYMLADPARPPVAALRAAGVPMAVATDANPGTSPVLSLPIAMHMACRLFGLAPGEALAGATGNAARALGRADLGVLAAGAMADLAVWDAAEPVELVYWLGRNLCHAVVRGGRVVP